jgi:branched-chain amino acid transport system substrate-binding protein
MKSMKMLQGIAICAATSMVAVGASHADIKIGATVSATGPAASLGIPYRNTLGLLPKEVAGQKIEWVILDDGSDPTNAVKNARKLTSEDSVDIILGANTSPIALALVDVASETKTPFIAMASSIRIVSPMDDKRYWVFKASQADALMVGAIADHMKTSNVKRAAFIGANDAFGESFWAEFEPAAKKAGIEIVASERFNRTDTSVTGQILKIVGAKPDAIFIAAVGTPAALPAIALKERGYNGLQYQSHAVLNADFLRVGGKALEGTFFPTGAMLIPEQLPDSNPIKKVALDYVTQYEKQFGAGTRATFGGHAYDSFLTFANAVPAALKVGKPGTPEFRKALRDEIEKSKDVVGSHGIFNITPMDHIGLDNRARMIVTVKDGTWKLVP